MTISRVLVGPRTLAIGAALAVVLPAIPIQALSGADVVTRARQVTAGVREKTMWVTLRISDRSGTLLERSLEGYEKTTETGRKVLWTFAAPADIAGTRFLALPEHLWVYFPAQRRVRQMSDELRRYPFQGANFTFDDLSTIFYFDYAGEHRLEAERACSSGDCYVVDTTLQEGRFAYSRLVSWIARDSYLPDRIEFFEGERLGKILRVQRSESVDGIPTVLEMEMESPDSGCRTTVKYADVHYNTGLADSLFTVTYLATGK
jgi:hypothetical protein